MDHLSRVELVKVREASSWDMYLLPEPEWIFGAPRLEELWLDFKAVLFSSEGG